MKSSMYKLIYFATSRFLWCSWLYICLPGTALAYLDPGSGSLLFQSFLAVIFGLGIALRAARQHLSNSIHRLLGRKRNVEK